MEKVFFQRACNINTVYIFLHFQFFRIHQVWPLGEALQLASQTLGDAQDTGVIFLSHLYLLLGLAVPVWLYTGVHGYHIGKLYFAIYCIHGHSSTVRESSQQCRDVRESPKILKCRK